MDVLNTVYDKLEKPKTEPLKYIRKSATKDSDIQNVLAEVFKLMLKRSGGANARKDALTEIFIQNFDSEQIWQQIEFKNKCMKSYIPSITKLLLSKSEVKFPYHKKGDLTDETPADCPMDENAQSVTVDEEDSSSDESDGDETGSDREGDEKVVDDVSSLNNREESSSAKRKAPTTGDVFFDMNKMEEFLDKAEQDNFVGEGNIDYFTDVEPADGNGASQFMYSDFFEDPQSMKKKPRVQDEDQEDEDFISEDGTDEEDLQKESKVKKGIKKNARNSDEVRGSKKVRFMSDDETSDGHSQTSDLDQKSTFEKKNLKLKEQIAKLEEDALSEKPWPQRGEVDAQQRPINSLLEEIVDVDLSSRPAPVITEKVTYDLETIIKTRIKNKAFDDVERKIKPVQVQHELKKELVLNQEKSKFSLAQIYEQEYLSKQEVNNEQDSVENKEMTEQKEEILKMMKSLFKKLDTLSNFHYTPKPVTEELKIISNAPAITVEEALPTAVAEGSTLAPQEIAGTKKKVLIGKDERTKTDKLRERRKKKSFLSKKMKHSKDKIGPVTKILKSKKVSLVEATGKEKAVKTSTKFFTQLQENTESGIISKKPKGKAVKYKPHK